MVGKIAAELYEKGLSCSECIFIACDRVYSLGAHKTCYDMLKAVSNGFGIGSVCSILTAAIMVFGIMFDETNAKRLRMELFSEVSRLYGGLSCPCLKKLMYDKGGCRSLIYEIGELTEKIINGQLK